MPIDYTKYSTTWFTKERPEALARAKHKCETCGVKNYAIGYRDENKVFIECDDFMQRWAEKTNKRVFKIVLTVAHHDWDVDNNEPNNLKVLCQLHHLRHDQQQHILSRKINAAKKKLIPRGF